MICTIMWYKVYLFPVLRSKLLTPQCCFPGQQQHRFSQQRRDRWPSMPTAATSQPGSRGVWTVCLAVIILYSVLETITAVSLQRLHGVEITPHAACCTAQREEYFLTFCEIKDGKHLCPVNYYPTFHCLCFALRRVQL